MEQSNFFTPMADTEERIVKLQQAMLKKNLQGTLIVQNIDLYYFSGTLQQGWLYVPAEGKPFLMIFKDFNRARSESPLEYVVSITSSKKIPMMLQEYNYTLPDVLGLELDVIPTNLYFQFQEIFSNAELVDISMDIRLIRAVKSSHEIALIRESARCSDLLAAKVPELLEVGKTEIQVAGELEAYARKLGHQGFVRMRLFNNELFYGHLLSGAAAAVPSYLASPTGGEGVSPAMAQGAGLNRIKGNEPILVDYVFIHSGYISDHTRIFSIGTLDDNLIKAHMGMIEVQKAMETYIVPGITGGEVYDEMVSMAEARGVGAFFMGAVERKIRFTGHGVGLELDEFPFLAKGQKLKIEENMVIALEPKVVIPGKGVVGIENTCLVTASGLEPLTMIDNEINMLLS